MCKLIFNTTLLIQIYCYITICSFSLSNMYDNILGRRIMRSFYYFSYLSRDSYW